jgi:hypothetical protein
VPVDDNETEVPNELELGGRAGTVPRLQNLPLALYAVTAPVNAGFAFTYNGSPTKALDASPDTATAEPKA